jgi:hypothetical protein
MDSFPVTATRSPGGLTVVQRFVYKVRVLSQLWLYSSYYRQKETEQFQNKTVSKMKIN